MEMSSSLCLKRIPSIEDLPEKSRNKVTERRSSSRYTIEQSDTKSGTEEELNAKSLLEESYT